MKLIRTLTLSSLFVASLAACSSPNVLPEEVVEFSSFAPEVDAQAQFDLADP
jgi:hypothetical protein